MIRLTTNFGTIDIELDYKNSKEKLIKSFNKKIPGKKFFPGIYLSLIHISEPTRPY